MSENTARRICIHSLIRKMTDAIGFDPAAIRHYADLPYLPVTLFKELRLSSLPT